MGGTSLDASLVLDSQPVLHHGAEFEGLPINTPSLYIHTIGSGGSYNHLEAGDTLANETGGGGGCGDPFTRDPAAVARDVRNGFVSAVAARESYGVAVRTEDFTVDDAATATLRAGARTD
ncbi:hydantoinase/oxoprolinase family protein [Streptomyces winkii]|uniref:hydantoinase/oxoprolinase family protein n=1 Tax=Streptomyces winkii TaxID=3051178 RepID=UPI0028D37E85|nr:hydantoinase/oxoprolinase family protein [Streptomyces sp. DSM 40971]